MVKLLEELTSKEQINLKELKQITNYPTQQYECKTDVAKKYSCDCDGWGGGEPPCDNGRLL